jgi:AraC-like DNA-binding protein
MKDGSIAICFVRSSLAPVVEQGGDVDAILRGVGLAPALLDQPQARVTAQQFSALWLAVARTLDDELFGQDGRRMKTGSFAMLCQTLVHSSTLESALHRMTRFFNLLLDDFQCSVVKDGAGASLQIRHSAGRRASPVFGCETLLTMQLGLACWLIGRRIPIVSADFCYPAPAHSAEYPTMYSPQLRFDQPSTRLSFERSMLALPVIQHPESAARFVQMAPANFLMKYKNSEGLAAQIRRRLRAAARCDWPSFIDFASRLHMTPSTLRRRLQDEGQSFREIKDQVRRDMAIDYLSCTDHSVTAIASDLGFSEASAFHRAFKKWTGTNPGQYRERVLQQMPLAPV